MSWVSSVACSLYKLMLSASHSTHTDRCLLWAASSEAPLKVWLMKTPAEASVSLLSLLLCRTSLLGAGGHPSVYSYSMYTAAMWAPSVLGVKRHYCRSATCPTVQQLGVHYNGDEVLQLSPGLSRSGSGLQPAHTARPPSSCLPSM